MRFGIGHHVVAGGLFVTGLACSDRTAPALEQCGNGIIEPAAGEDCEPVQDPARCGAAGTAAQACRWTCAEEPCPDGFQCGDDAICRRPCLGHQGEPTCSPFASLSTDVTTADVAEVVLLDVDGDSRPEILTVESATAQRRAAVRIHAYDGESFVAGPERTVGYRPTLTTIDDGSTSYLFAADAPLPAGGASGPGSRAAVSRLTDDLTLTEVLVQGPETVADEAIKIASYAVPADVPELGGTNLLFGLREDTVWWPSDTPAEALTNIEPAGPPDMIVGPVVGQPFDPDVAAADGANASASCPTLVFGYRGATDLHTANPCTAVAEWTSAPLTTPEFPDGRALGDGLVLADLNADDLDDLVVTTDDARIHVAYAVGDGTFHSDATALPAADGDGRFDEGVGAGLEPGEPYGAGFR
ncbi:MAG: hypothetical protein AAF721_25045, partial [Myxococcota bacterium]